MRVKVFGILSAFFLSIFFGCTPRPEAPATKETEGVAVARVGDIIITDKILMDRVATIEKTYPRVYSTQTQKRKLLEEMMNIELLFQQAMKEHLNEKYEFKSRLADLYVQRLAEDARNKITDAEVRKAYEADKRIYEQISARHILLKFPAKPTAAEKKDLRKKIEKIRDEALKAPSQFPELARENSDDTTKNNGGELGFFSYKMMVPPFSEAAFKLKQIGEISPVVESEFGYHIIQLSGDRRNFDDYKGVIKDQLIRTSQRDRLDTEIARLKAGKKLEIYDENLVKLSPLPEEIQGDPDKILPEKIPGLSDSVKKE